MYDGSINAFGAGTGAVHHTDTPESGAKIKMSIRAEPSLTKLLNYSDRFSEGACLVPDSRQAIRTRSPSLGALASRNRTGEARAATDDVRALRSCAEANGSSSYSADTPALLVSIIIANFNYAEFVGAAIASALAQTYTRIEVIVVDDGSTDDSIDEISRFLPAIQFVHVKHQGQIGACTEGFKLSRGDVLIFLDADDVLLPDAVERLCRPFLASRNIVKVQGYMSVIDREGQAMGERIPGRLPESGDYRALTLRHGLLPLPFAYTSGNAWSRVYLQQVFPLPTVGWLDDYLHDLAPLHGRIESLPEAVVGYRVHGNNSWYGSRVLAPQTMRDYIDKVNRNIDYLVAFMGDRGYPTDPLRWRRYKRSWRDMLIEFTLNRTSDSGRGISWLDFVSAPYGRGQAGLLKAIVVSGFFSVIWLLPKGPSTALAQWLLRSKGGWL